MLDSKRPFAALMPAKYAGMSVEELLPCLRPDRPLRISTISSSAISTYSFSGGDRKRRKKNGVRCKEITFKFGPPPAIDKLLFDEEKFLRPVKKRNDPDDVRFEPAQLWHDRYKKGKIRRTL